MREFEAAGIQVYAITYDPQPALKRFADTHGITFQLLSDVGSVVIKRFGILNTLIDPDDPDVRHPTLGVSLYGIPFPGTYVVDESGIVTEKFFNRHYATRPSAGTILGTALGKVLIHEDSRQTNHRDGQAKITAFLADEDFKLEVVGTLYCRIEMAEGLHIYANPLPEGFFPTQVHVKQAPGLRIGQPIYPPTKPLELEALGVTLNVFSGVVLIAVPITATAELFQPREQDSITLDIDVFYQAGSATYCYLPRTVNLSLEVPLAELVSSRQ